MKHTIFALFALTAGLSSVSAATFVANSGAGAASLSKDEIKQILLGDVTRWQGSAVKLAVIDSSSADDVYQEYTGKTASQFESYWKRQVFTGKGIMPKGFADDAELLEYIAETPGSVGFILADEAPGTVETISVE